MAAQDRIGIAYYINLAAFRDGARILKAEMDRVHTSIAMSAKKAAAAQAGAFKTAMSAGIDKQGKLAFKEIGDSLTKIGGKVPRLQKDFEKLFKTFQGDTSRIGTLKKEFVGANKAISDHSAVLNAAGKDGKAFYQHMDRAALVQAKLRGEVTSYGSWLKNVNAVEQASSGIKQVQTQATTNATSALKKMGITSRTTTKQIQNMNLSTEQYRQVSSLTTQQLKRLEKATISGGAATRLKTDRLDSMSQRLAHSQIAIGKHSVATVASGRATVKASAELRKMGITSRTTTEQFQNMNLSQREHAKVAGLTTQQMKMSRDATFGSGEAAKRAGENYEKMSQRLAHSKDAMKAHTGATVASGKASLGATSELRRLGITSRTTTKQFQAMNLTEREHQKVIDATTKQMKLNRAATFKSGAAANRAGENYSRMSKRLAHSQMEVRKHTQSMGDSRRAMERWSLSGMKAMMMSQAAWIASGAVIFGTLALIGKGIKDVITTHQELKNLRAITSASTKEMVTMEKAIRRASVGTKFFAADMTKVATVMGQAGFKAHEIANAISSVAVLASATGRELTEVADLMTTIIRAYELNADQSLRVANTLAAGIRRSKIQIEDLKTAFNYMGVAAHLFNMSLEDTVAWLGVLRNQGLKATTAGTSFRGVLATLVKETDKFSKVLKNLPEPLGFTDVTISRGRKLEDSMKRLMDAGFGIDDAFRGLPRRTAMTFGLMVKNVETQKKLSKEITGTNDAIEMNKIAMEGMASQLAQTKSIFDEFMLSVTRSGGAMEPFVQAIKIIVQIMSSGILTITTFLTLLLKAVAVMGSLGEIKIKLPSGPSAEDPFAPESPGGIDTSQLKMIYDEYSKDVENIIENYMQSINRIMGKEPLFGGGIVSSKEEEDVEKLKQTYERLKKEKDELLKQFRSPDVKKGSKDYEELQGKLQLVNAQLFEIETSLKLVGDATLGPISNLSDLMAAMAIKPGSTLDEMVGVFRKGEKDIRLMEKALVDLRAQADKLVKRFEEGEFVEGDAEYERMLSLAKQVAEAEKKLGSVRKKIAKEAEDAIKAQLKALKAKTDFEMDAYEKDLKARKKHGEATIKLDSSFAKFRRKIFKDLAKEEDSEQKQRRDTELQNYKSNMDVLEKLLKEAKKKRDALFYDVEADWGLLPDLQELELTITEMEKFEEIVKRLHLLRLEDIGVDDTLGSGLAQGFKEALNELEDFYKTGKQIATDLVVGFTSDLSSLFADAMNQNRNIRDAEEEENKSHQERLAEINRDYARRGESGSQEHLQAIEDANYEHAKKMRNISEEMTISMGDLWDSMRDRIINAMADIAAQWIALSALKGIGGGWDWLGGLFHSGGSVPATVPTTRGGQGGGYGFHGGGWVEKMHAGGLKSNELLSKLKVNEYVIKDTSARSIGRENLDQMNRTGQMPQGQTVVDQRRYNYYVSAIDPESFDQVLRTKGARAIHDVSLGSFGYARSKRDPRVR